MDHVTTPPSPLGPGHNTSPPPRDQVTAPPSPLGPGYNTSLPQDQVTTPPSPPLDNTSLPPHLYTTPPPPPPPRTRSQPLPPPTSPGTMRRRAVRILLECILVNITIFKLVKITFLYLISLLQNQFSQ